MSTWEPTKPPAYKIRKGCEAADWKELFDAVCENTRALPSLKDNRALRNIVDYLNWYKCSTVLVGSPFHDRDYLYDYLHHFGSIFEDCGRDCIRLHFFSGDRINRDSPLRSLRELVSGLERPRPLGFEQSGYLGFMVLRPTGRYCVGRTILKYPDQPMASWDIHTRARYDVHLHGVNLRVVGAPFMQQDASSHVCAGAALWCLLYDLHRRYGTPRRFPRQITEIAREQFTGIKFPTGHTPAQIAHVLREVGCAQDVQYVEMKTSDGTPKDDYKQVFRKFVDTVYGYVQSNLPLILGFKIPGYPEVGKEQGHAVMVVGHDHSHLTTSETSDPRAWGRFGCSSERVGSFICQDDGRGAYQPLRVWKSAPKLPFISENAWSEAPVLENADWLFMAPGLTRDAHMLYDQARGTLRTGLINIKALVDVLSSGYVLPAGTLPDIEAVEDTLPDCFVRLYIQQSRRFRRFVLDKVRGRWKLDESHIEVYQQMPLPRYVWVCDVCDPKDTDSQGRFRAIAEFVLDATAPKFAQPSSLLAFRVGRLLRVTRGAFSRWWEAPKGTPDPYAPLNAEDY